MNGIKEINGFASLMVGLLVVAMVAGIIFFTGGFFKEVICENTATGYTWSGTDCSYVTVINATHSNTTVVVIPGIVQYEKIETGSIALAVSLLVIVVLMIIVAIIIKLAQSFKGEVN